MFRALTVLDQTPFQVKQETLESPNLTVRNIDSCVEGLIKDSGFLVSGFGQLVQGVPDCKKPRL